MLQIPGLHIQHTSSKGRGVFTSIDVESGNTIEICPVIIIPSPEVQTIHNTSLHDYYFRWGTNFDQAAIALGLGSIYNHSESPNAKIILDFENLEIIVESISDIKAGQEITINYIDDKGSTDKLWFEIR